eukprot:6180054-Pleurochrysis_carterae.AAC.2
MNVVQDALSKFGADGLLLIGGVDGRNDPRSDETIGWLLAGLSGREVFGGGDSKLRLLLEVWIWPQQQLT